MDGKESGNCVGHRHISDHVKRWLIETRGEKCEICGWAETNRFTGKIPITAHHLDGNSENTIPSNMQLLCPNCHSLTRTYGGANRGNGRLSKRRLRVSPLQIFGPMV